MSCSVTICSAQPAADQRDAHTLGRADTESLTVMTWNLEWFYDDYQGDNYSDLGKEKSAPDRQSWDWRRDAIAASIARASPTIAAVQEVENRRVLWYLSRALARNHKAEYHELGAEGRDFFTEQDVGFLYRPPVDALSVIQSAYPKRLRSTNQYYDVTKHLMGVFEIQHAGGLERILLMNVHLRSTPEAESLRIKQARLVHLWIAQQVRAGENVILLGDFNTEVREESSDARSDVGVARGLETSEVGDDLVDLNLKLEESDRRTHLLGGQYDRIFCSSSLLKDDPSRPDLVFQKIEVRRDLAIRGRPDTADEHWENFWQLHSSERDLSDHYPVIATFDVR